MSTGPWTVELAFRPKQEVLLRMSPDDDPIPTTIIAIEISESGVDYYVDALRGRWSEQQLTAADA